MRNLLEVVVLYSFVIVRTRKVGVNEIRNVISTTMTTRIKTEIFKHVKAMIFS